MMKGRLFYLLPFLALAGCGEPSYKDASLSPERRAELLVKELNLYTIPLLQAIIFRR